PLFEKSGTKNFYASYATPQAPQSSCFASLSGWVFSASALNNGKITQARCAGKPQPNESTENWAAGSLRMRKHPSKVFLVLFVHNRRCQRAQCKHGLQIAERRGGKRAERS
ncbi:hypothetical protein, partial [uncultured Rikenella sp.]